MHRVAHASRVLAKASGVRELSLDVASSLPQRQFRKSSFRRDVETSTRDACATHGRNDRHNRIVKKKLKVLVLFDGTSPTALDQDFSKEMKTKDWKTEADVMAALGKLGHTAEHLAIYDNVDLVRQKLEAFAPDILFNLVEQFRNNPGFDQNIASFFEMQGLPFTGCGATGLTLCKHKGISKKILHYHGIHVPNFVVIPRGQRIGRPRQLEFPILVKPVKEEASYGISQASFIQTDEQFRERVAFVHEKGNADAIAEQYIDGRELYVSLLGNVRLTVFPIREMFFGDA